MEISFTAGERAIPPAVRREVIARDGMVCRRCGRVVRHRKKGEPYDPAHIHLDHVQEWAAGGDHDPSNLIVSCAGCNLRRPKPKAVRTAKVRARYRNGTYYWLDGYEPPTIASGDSVSLMLILRAWGQDALMELLYAIARGELPATGGTGPVRIAKPDWWDAQPPEVRGVRQSKSAPAPTPSPDPERVAYWQQVIQDGRARRRAAKTRESTVTRLQDESPP